MKWLGKRVIIWKVSLVFISEKSSMSTKAWAARSKKEA